MLYLKPQKIIYWGITRMFFKYFQKIWRGELYPFTQIIQCYFFEKMFVHILNGITDYAIGHSRSMRF